MSILASQVMPIMKDAVERGLSRQRQKHLSKMADTIENHLYGLVNASVTGLTNGGAESLNAKIQKIKHTARGYRNKDHFINAIYFHCGKLDMAF